MHLAVRGSPNPLRPQIDAINRAGRTPSRGSSLGGKCVRSMRAPCLVWAGWQASNVEIRYLQPDGLMRSPAFSHGAVVPPGATTIYIGGQNGVDETGKVVAGNDAAAQAVRAVDNVETVLRAAGATLADVVAWTVLIAADADVAAAYGAIASRLARTGAPPLVTAARVAGLAVPGALLEISAIAALTAD
jgi:enamine deaminase RidA (YjgF/YER057c/UK114 family)